MSIPVGQPKAHSIFYLPTLVEKGRISCPFKISLIAGNSCTQDNQQPSRNNLRKVQRLSRKGVHLSKWKQETPEMGEDIV